MAKKDTPPSVPSARNRKALRDYFIEEKIEAGIVLTGTEVKSLRLGRANINEAFAREAGGEIWLEGAHIPHYNPAGKDNHEPNRSRKLLLHRRQIARMIGQINRAGYTLVPLALFFNSRGMAKVEIGLGKGKHTYDKRQAVKDRDWKRQKERLMRDRG
ncbi:MAG: SsrA-binding protein SmpB [Proteobacteria bacterium]|jgi:SsrA-binding protein|nr:SsrA-binding protein SmpB [Pseudomonadota bacterium]MDA1071504.1 SsrA-binding protein SmpB [Pseudomonadota bacterium]